MTTLIIFLMWYLAVGVVLATFTVGCVEYCQGEYKNFQDRHPTLAYLLLVVALPLACVVALLICCLMAFVNIFKRGDGN